MLLYLESQLVKAYRVYITKIPIGQTIPDLEFFREMMEGIMHEMMHGMMSELMHDTIPEIMHEIMRGIMRGMN